MRLALAVLAPLVALSACGTPNAQGAASAPSGFVTDAADLGGGRWFITCAYQASACTWRAQHLCAQGFDVEGAQSSQAPVGFIGPYGGGVSARTDYQMTVRCR